MRKIYYAAFLFIIAPFLLFAQDSTNTNVPDGSQASNYYLLSLVNDWTDEDYNDLLDSLKQYHTTDFFKLRMCYTKTSGYDPYSVVISDMFKKVYKLLNTEDYKKALPILEDILNKKYVSFEAHALSAFCYSMLQDSVKQDYHTAIYHGLIGSIMDSGDGKDPQTAFIVIGTDEEYELLEIYNLQHGNQNLVNSEGHNFDMLDAKDRESGEEFNIYFNVDLLFKQLEKQFR